jgi:hypothetical protein
VIAKCKGVLQNVGTKWFGQNFVRKIGAVKKDFSEARPE